MKSGTEQPKKDRLIAFSLPVIFSVTAVVLFLLAFLSYGSYAREYRTQFEHQLSAVADLKAAELSAWRSERLGDAEVIMKSPLILNLLEGYVTNPSDQEIADHLQQTLNIVLDSYRYDAVMFFEPNGTHRLAAPASVLSEPVDEHLLTNAELALASERVIFLDFHIHREGEDKKIYVSLLVPVYAGGRTEYPLGVILLRIDPDKYLFPLLASWPVTSETAETLLVRRDGRDVLFLNPLRFQPESVLELRFPLNDSDRIAARALEGESGIIEGLDYRGQEAIAVARTISGSPWHLIARVDRAEVYGPLTNRFWETIIFFGALLAVSGSALVLLWRRQHLRHLREQARVNRELAESETLNRAVMDNLPIGLAINTVFPTVDFIYMNDNFYKIYRTTREALSRPDAFWEAVYEDPGFRREMKAQILKDCAAGNPDHMQWHEIPLTRRGEVIAYISAGNTPIPGKELVISTVWDVTEQKKAEEKLKENYALLQIAGNTAKFGGWSADLAKDVVTWSEEVAKIHDLVPGYSPPVNRGINFYAPEWRDKIAKVFNDCAEKGIPYDEEMEIISARGRRRWVRTIGRAVRDDSGRIVRVQGAFQDITEKKLAEEEIRRLNEELEQRVRERTAQLEAAIRELESFAYSVSHDLRAPLRSMSGFSDQLLEQYSEQFDDQGRHYLERIGAAAENMGQLIDGLLGLSRLTRTAFHEGPVDLSTLAKEIAAELQEKDPQRRIEWLIEEDLSARGDRELLRLVLVNLMGNAWKFTGKVSRPRIEVGMKMEGPEVVYYVRDNGAGFNMAYADKLFAPFQRLHRTAEYPGTGIGLATVQRIISRHGGRIWAEAALNRGAVFYFTLGGVSNEPESHPAG